MSRIGKAPITVPSGVDITIDGTHVTVKGSKGTLTHVLPDEITMGRFVLPATARVATGAITNERYLNDRIQFTRL